MSLRLTCGREYYPRYDLIRDSQSQNPGTPWTRIRTGIVIVEPAVSNLDGYESNQ